MMSWNVRLGLDNHFSVDDQHVTVWAATVADAAHRVWELWSGTGWPSASISLGLRPVTEVDLEAPVPNHTIYLTSSFGPAVQQPLNRLPLHSALSVGPGPGSRPHDHGRDAIGSGSV